MHVSGEVTLVLAKDSRDERTICPKVITRWVPKVEKALPRVSNRSTMPSGKVGA